MERIVAVVVGWTMALGEKESRSTVRGRSATLSKFRGSRAD
jgi:hypothetical protein